MRLSNLTNSTPFVRKTVNITIIDLQQSQFKHSQKCRLNLILPQCWDSRVQDSIMQLPQTLCCMGLVAFRTSLIGKKYQRVTGILKELKEVSELFPGQYFTLPYRPFICFGGFLKRKASSQIFAE